MNKNLLIVLALLAGQNVCASDFTHTLGLSYSSFNGSYGNSDMMGLMYNPQFLKSKGHLVYGLAFPMTYSRIVTSGRSETNNGVLEVPLSFEMTYNAYGFGNGFKGFSVFAGAGMSRLVSMDNVNQGLNFINGTVGARLPVYHRAIEVRLGYSRNSIDQDQIRYSLSLGYVLCYQNKNKY